jgi:hypothetical protein
VRDSHAFEEAGGDFLFRLGGIILAHCPIGIRCRH